MNNKFLREIRELTRLFCLEHAEDPDLARSNLEDRLNEQRNQIRQDVYRSIQNRLPGAEPWLHQ